ncbi:hypothetical protein [Azospirillum melinis]
MTGRSGRRSCTHRSLYQGFAGCADPSTSSAHSQSPPRFRQEGHAGGGWGGPRKGGGVLTWDARTAMSRAPMGRATGANG